MRCTVGIYVFDGVELLDFAGPYEVFTCAARVHGKHAPDLPPLFQVVTVGATAATVQARAGLGVLPDTQFSSVGPLDVLIVPGGVVGGELDKPAVADWIARTARACPLVASVCTGALLLAQAGLLDDQDATTHWEDLADLRRMFPRVRVHAERRWIDNGHIVTSAGISAGIDMSLHLVERLAGRELARATAHQMDYDWREA